MEWDETILWAETAGALAASLGAPMRAEQAPSSRRPIDPEAWNQYAQGRQMCAAVFAGRFGDMPPELAGERAVLALESSVKLDTGFPAAYGALASCLLSRSTVGYAPPGELSPKARNAALRAISLDRSQGEAYAFLGAVRRDYDWDWDGAEDAFRRAIELDNGSAVAHSPYSLFLAAVGMFDSAHRTCAHGRQPRSRFDHYSDHVGRHHGHRPAVRTGTAGV